MEGEDRNTCYLCKAVFKVPQHKLRHLRNQHGINTSSHLKIGHKCSHPDCSETSMHYANNELYRQHLHDIHSVPDILRVNQLIFYSWDDVISWKEDIEKEGRAHFLISRGSRKTLNGLRRVYECHRGGEFVSRGGGKRRLKAQGSCKSGHHCPASITVDSLPDGVHVVKYFPTHFGHKLEMEHLRLSSTDKVVIADKLASGLPADKILSEIRGSVVRDVERKHLVTRQDIYNIRKLRGISEAENTTQENQSFHRLDDSFLSQNMMSVTALDTQLINEINAAADSYNYNTDLLESSTSDGNVESIKCIVEELSVSAQQLHESNSTTAAILNHLKSAKLLFDIQLKKKIGLGNSKQASSETSNVIPSKHMPTSTTRRRSKRAKLCLDDTIQYDIIHQLPFGCEEVIADDAFGNNTIVLELAVGEELQYT